MSPGSGKTETLFRECITQLARLIQDIRIYPADHPEITRKLDSFFTNLNTYFEKQEMLIFAVIDEEIIFDGKPRADLTESLPLVIRLFKENRFAKLSLLRGLGRDELIRFCRLIGQEGKLPEAPAKRRNVLIEKGIAHVLCENISEEDDNIPLQSLQAGDADSQRELKREIEKIRQNFDEIAGQSRPDLDYMLSIVNHFTPQVLQHYDEILFLGSLKSHSVHSFDHVLNVAVLCCLMGRALRLPEKVLEQLCVAGFLYDIGKKEIPSEILNKPGKLDADEMALMETHSVAGAKSLLLNGSFSEIVVIAAFEHHRNFDGSGYPVSRKKRRPSLISRIIMIADFYDAVRGIRSYSTEKAPEEVFALMQNLKGKKFDPELLDLFFHIIGMYPPGTHVQLTTGETAIVTAHNPRDIFRPAVRLVTDAAGTPLEDGPEIALDEKHNNLFIRSVSRSLQLSGDST